MYRLSPEKEAEINDMAFEIRKISLEMITHAGWGHLGGSFSLAEILASLYFGVLNFRPEQPDWDKRDYVVLSKAHCSPVLYSTLVLKGVLQKEDIFSYCTSGGLEGHLDVKTPGVESCGGSLGLGLSYAAGIALTLKKKQEYAQRVYCILGDGEMSEGQVWEAAMFASHYRLDNLIAVLDCNKVMAKGFVNEMTSLEPVYQKLKAFGWNVMEADGHDVRELMQTYYEATYIAARGKPVCIIAHTVKGKGVRECEFNYKWHTHAPSKEQAREFFEELKETYEKPDARMDDIVFEGHSYDKGLKDTLAGAR